MDIFECFSKERDGCDLIRTEFGFASVIVVSDVNLFCHQFYVHPDHRDLGHGRKLLESVKEYARLKLCTTVSCTVQSQHRLRHETLCAVIAGGFKFCGLNKQGDLYFEQGVS